MKSMTGTILGALLLTGLTAPVYAAGETPEEQAALAEAVKDTKAEQAFVKHAEKDIKHAMKDLTEAEKKFEEELREDAARK